MARSPRYIVDNKKKEVRAFMYGLNSKEIKLLHNYSEIGYAIIPIEEVPNKVNVFKLSYIKAYCKEKGIDFAPFEAIANAPATDKNGKTKYREKKDGTKTVIKQGFVKLLQEFRSDNERVEDFTAWVEANPDIIKKLDKEDTKKK